MKYDIFISYRREGGYDTAKHINDLLVRDGYRVSFDIDTLRNGDFDEQLFKRIEECKDFILVIDKHAFDRTIDPTFDPQKDWLRCELAHALKHKKNIIPVFLSGVEGFPEGLPYDVVGVIYKNGPEYNKYYFNDFYKQLCSRFLKSHGRRYRLTILGVCLIALIGFAGLLIHHFLNEDVFYVDPLLPERTTENMLTDYIDEILQNIIDSVGNKDSILVYKEWYDAVQKGNPEALLYLGLSNYVGYGCEPNIENAINWLKQSAKLENERAQYILSVCYNRAIGMEQNYDMAKKICQKAANKGIMEAQYDYAIYCADNYNSKETYKWLYEAAEHGYPPAQYAIAVALSNQANTVEEAVTWLEIASENGFATAKLVLSRVYIEGPTKFRNISKAIAMLKDLSNDNNPIASYMLGICYAKGVGVDQEQQTALDLLEQSAKYEYPPALVDLGALYCEGGFQFDQDYTKAMNLWLKAAEAGHPMAQFYIGTMYENGWGVRKSNYQSYKWYRKASKQGIDRQSIQLNQQQTYQKLLDILE